MTLDEVIKHCEEVAELNEWFDKNCLENMQCREYAEEHRQLAEWLKELKALREVCISKAFDMTIEALGQTDILDKIRAEIEKYKSKQLTLAIGVADLEAGKQIAIEYILSIIDKYKAESERVENDD